MSRSELPTTEKPSRQAPALHPALYIASWIFFSNGTILFNKWLLDSAGFKYPVILTCWHLIFATAATQVLARTTHLLDSRKDVKMTGRTYVRAVVPIGVLYSGSLVCSNLVYLYLSVAFIQMLKAAAPVAVLFASWAWGLKEPSWDAFLKIVLIVFGVVLASVGEIEFNWIGFFFQLGGIVFEALRITLIEVLLKGEGQKMDPLVSLYYYAPVCAVMNLFVAMMTEFGSFEINDLWDTGVGMLVLNAGIAFMLNVSSVFLIGKTSGLVLTLAGILKNVLLIIASVVIWHTSVSTLQFFGYTIALGGLLVYSDTLNAANIAKLTAWGKKVLESPSLDEGRLSPLLRRVLIIVLVLLMAGMLLAGFSWSGEADTAGRHKT